MDVDATDISGGATPATSPGDFSAIGNVEVTLPAVAMGSETTATFSRVIVDDKIVEPVETFEIKLKDDSDGEIRDSSVRTTTVNILNDDGRYFLPLCTLHRGFGIYVLYMKMGRLMMLLNGKKYDNGSTGWLLFL